MVLIAPSKDVYDPAKKYVRVRWIGDRLFQDFEGIEAQQIQDDARRQLGDEIFSQGAILSERGGTIATPIAGVSVGAVAAVSSGIYRGNATQIYTLKVIQGGGAGSAKIHVTSDGADNGSEGEGYDISVGSGDPLNGTIFYDVGREGVRVAFNDSKAIKNFIVADSWTILATYSRQLPAVSGSTITPPDINLYVDGRVILIPSKAMIFPPLSSGKTAIFVEVIRDIVTGDIDTELKAEFNNLICAERERVAGQFVDRDTSNDPLPSGVLTRRVFPAYLWDRATNKVERATVRSLVIQLDEIPGQLPASSLANLDFSEELRGVLAQHNDDITGGSYRIEGLRAHRSTNAAPANKVFITVEKGTARISGLRVKKTIEEDLLIDLAIETATVLDEAKTFASGTNIYALNKAVGANRLPIQQIAQVTAIVQVTRQITKGSTNGLDELPDQPVSSIVSVVKSPTTYVAGTDYVQNGNFVDWSPGGAEVTTGQSYDVTYRYTKQMIPITDYLLVDSDGDGDLDSVDFSPAGDNPVNSTVFFVDYAYFLPRLDLIFLRTDGVFEIIRGTPADSPQEPRPPTEFLGIALIELAANSLTNIKVTNLDNERVPMSAIRNSIRRQEDQRRNDAMQDLLNQTILRETAVFNGVFTDAFALDDIADLTFSRNGGAGGHSPGVLVAFDALIDFFRFELSLPVTAETRALVANNTLIPAGQIASKLNRDFATLPFSEVLEISQDQWSDQVNVNPFATFLPPPANVELTPDKDIGMSEVTSTISDVWVTSQHGLVRVGPGQTIDEIVRRIAPLGQRVSVTREETARLVEERGLMFMREIVVTVRGRGYLPGEDNIVGKFDGKLVVLIPLGTTVAGTTAGSVKASPSILDSNNQVIQVGGDWEAKFTIPANVPVGVRSFVATGSAASKAQASYEGHFVERLIQIFQRETIRFTDPLAQTFAFSQPTTLVRVQVPFAKKGPLSDAPLELQLRGVQLPGGFPDFRLYESVKKRNDQIVLADVGTNNFVFGNPMLQDTDEYRGVVLLSNSNNYHVYAATLGRPGQNPLAYITENPNVRGSEPAGILLESLNALNWEARSKSALRYKVFRADFSPESWIYFNRISSVEYSLLFLGVDQVLPIGTDLSWQVSIDGLAIGDGGKKWLDILPLTMLNLDTIATTIDVRVKLSTTSSRVSPYINFNNWHLKGFLYKAAGKYISKRTTTLQDIDSVKLYVEVQVPTVGTLNWFISNAEDASLLPIWEAVTVVDADVDMGDGFRALTLSKTLNNAIADKTNFRKLRVRADLATSNKARTTRVRNLALTFV